MVALNQQQTQWTKIQRNLKQHWITGNSVAGTDSSKCNQKLEDHLKVRAWHYPMTKGQII